MSLNPFNSKKVKNFFLYLVSVLVVVVVVLGFLWIFYSLVLILQGSTQASGVATRATIYLFFLKLTGTLAFVLIGLTMVTGALRSFLISFYKSASFWETHTKWTSSLGLGIAFSHFLIYLLYQNRLKVPLELRNFLPTTESLKANSNLIFIALFALVLLTINAIIAHVPGVTGKKWWRPLHILNYLAILLILLHAFYLGSDSGSNYFRSLYTVVLVLVLLGMVYRIIKVILKRRKSVGVVVNKPEQASKVQSVPVSIQEQSQTKVDTPSPQESESPPDLSPPEFRN